MTQPKWQRARVIVAGAFKGRTLWVTGKPDLKRVNMVYLKPNNDYQITQRVVDDIQFDTNIFAPGYHKPMATAKADIELLPIFADEVETESLEDWLKKK